MTVSDREFETSELSVAKQFTKKKSKALMARLREAGVNVNLAPVADVAQPGSVMAGRAFTGDVAGQVLAVSRELSEAGVMPTVKHYPGFGRATENTDDAPVTIDATRAELEADLEPFRAAFEAGAGAEVFDYRPDLGALVIGFLPGRALDDDAFADPGVLRRAAAKR